MISQKCHLMQTIFTANCDTGVCVHAFVSGGWGGGLIVRGSSVLIRQFVYGCSVTYLYEKIDSVF